MKATHIALALLALVTGSAWSSARSARADDLPPVPTLDYALVDTWAERPWPDEPGWFGSLDDLSSIPSGRLAVVDGQRHRLHWLDAEGQLDGWLDLEPLVPAESWRAMRIDGGADGRFHLLLGAVDPAGKPTGEHEVLSLGSDGVLEARTSLETRAEGNWQYADLAAAPDGHLHLLRRAPKHAEDSPAADIEVHAIGLGLLETYRPPVERFVYPGVIDIAEDGRIYVDNRWRECVESGCLEHGQVLELDRRRELQGIQDLKALDLAAGPEGAFIAVPQRAPSLFRLDDLKGEPVLRSPGWVTAVDVASSGRLHVLGADEQFGVATFHPDRPEAGISFAGQRFTTEPAGPFHPRRLDVDIDLSLLRERYEILDSQPPLRRSSYKGKSTHSGLRHSIDEPDEVVRWSLDGVAIGRWRDIPFYPRDVASAGTDTFFASMQEIWRLSDGQPAKVIVRDTWCKAPFKHRLFIAISAESGRIAALDERHGEVLIYDAAGMLLAYWPIDPDGLGWDAIDLSLAGGRIYLADAGAGRVQVRALDGAILSAFDLHDAPERLSATAGGLVVLGRDDWLMRYTEEGRLVAWWRLPRPDASSTEESSERYLEAGDAAMDAEGRVYVPWFERAPLPARWAGHTMPTWALPRAGIWVFAPVGTGPETLPSCLIDLGAEAEPRRSQVGSEVNVRMSIEGSCAIQPRAGRIILVQNTSPAFRQQVRGEFRPSWMAMTALPGLIRRLDGRKVGLGLVTWEAGGTLRLSPSHDRMAVIQALNQGAGSGQDADLGGAINLARRELGAAEQATGRRALWIVLDGREDPLPLAEIAAARDEGIEVFALVFAASAYRHDPSRQAALAEAFGGPEQVIVDLDPERDAEAVAQLTAARRPDLLLGSARVDLDLPTELSYLGGSAFPVAIEEPEGLAWALPPVLAPGFELGYRLQSRQAGEDQDAHAGARLHYVDFEGRSGTLDFPVPRVDVMPVPPSPTPNRHRALLPYSARQHCLRQRPDLELVLVLDSSSSMGEPGPDGRSGQQAAREAISGLLDQVELGRDRVALVSFHTLAERRLGLVSDRTEIEAALAGLELGVGTRLDAGIAEAGDMLARQRRSSARPVVLLLTDGRQDQMRELAFEQSTRLNRMGAQLYTVGYGRAVDHRLLESLAEPGRHLTAPDAESLSHALGLLASSLTCGR